MNPKLMRLSAASFVSLLILSDAHCQLPVLKANSRNVDIVDGANLRKNIWTVSPDVQKDIYFSQRSISKKTVTFKSDVDSLTFEISPGETKDFVIHLEGKFRCHTQISATRSSAKRSSGSASSTIPFKYGRDQKIHIQVKINNSPPLDFMFDTGADTTVMFPSGIKKAGQLKYDDKIENIGAGGSATRQVSNSNDIEIADLAWSGEPIMKIESQADQADGIIGWNLFEDKIVEFDFENKLITVHDELPKDRQDYASTPIQWEGTLPTIRTHFRTGEIVFDEWCVIDTGSNSAAMLNRSAAKSHSIYGNLNEIGTASSRGVGGSLIKSIVAQFKTIQLSSKSLKNVPVLVQVENSETDLTKNLLGMQILKRYNLIIDYQKSTAYFKPNSLDKEPYKIPRDNKITLLVVTSLAAAILLPALILMRRRKLAPKLKA